MKGSALTCGVSSAADLPLHRAVADARGAQQSPLAVELSESVMKVLVRRPRVELGLSESLLYVRDWREQMHRLRRQLDVARHRGERVRLSDCDA